jgi:hypothetical protein
MIKTNNLPRKQDLIITLLKTCICITRECVHQLDSILVSVSGKGRSYNLDPNTFQ